MCVCLLYGYTHWITANNPLLATNRMRIKCHTAAPCTVLSKQFYSSKCLYSIRITDYFDCVFSCFKQVTSSHHRRKAFGNWKTESVHLGRLIRFVCFVRKEILLMCNKSKSILFTVRLLRRIASYLFHKQNTKQVEICMFETLIFTTALGFVWNENKLSAVFFLREFIYSFSLTISSNIFDLHDFQTVEIHILWIYRIENLYLVELSLSQSKCNLISIIS